HQGDALIDLSSQEIDATHEAGTLRTVERDVRLTRDLASALEYRAGSVEVSPDEGDVPQPGAGHGQAIRVAELFAEGHCLAAGLDPLLELPEIRQTTRQPGRGDSVKPRPGPARHTANRAGAFFGRRRLHHGLQYLDGAPVVAQGVAGEAKVLAGVVL